MVRTLNVNVTWTASPDPQRFACGRGELFTSTSVSTQRGKMATKGQIRRSGKMTDRLQKMMQRRILDDVRTRMFLSNRMRAIGDQKKKIAMLLLANSVVSLLAMGEA